MCHEKHGRLLRRRRFPHNPPPPPQEVPPGSENALLSLSPEFAPSILSEEYDLMPNSFLLVRIQTGLFSPNTCVPLILCGAIMDSQGDLENHSSSKPEGSTNHKKNFQGALKASRMDINHNNSNFCRKCTFVAYLTPSYF